MQFKFKKGLDIPLAGQPDPRIDAANAVTQVAVLGEDYVGLKPTMLVKVGDSVKIGTPLFEDKKNPGVVITAPASGKVADINRGAKRALISVVIDVEGDEAESVKIGDLASFTGEQLREKLQVTGLWAALRSRPYGKVPTVDSQPNSIFVTATDTNPLAVDPSAIITERAGDFAIGVTALDKFGVPVYVCHSGQQQLPEMAGNNINTAVFSGKHPAGLAGTHIHALDPVDGNKEVWQINYQDVIALGALCNDGRIDTRRYIALDGPSVNSPRVFETRLGAKVSELIEGRLGEGIHRVISGSVLNGHIANQDRDFLGRYDNQISVIEENADREFMGWIAPGAKKFSALNVFVSSLLKPKTYNITSSQNGSPRAIVPIGVFEKVMPLDILPTPLVKALLVKDTDAAQELGCLELIEEDLALCSFVDPGKHDFGLVLRSTLTQVEREG